MGMEENLDVSTLFIVKCAAHIKKSALEFVLISSKTYLGSLIGFSHTRAQTFVRIQLKRKESLYI